MINGEMKWTERAITHMQLTYAWNGATPGAHTLVSGVTDVTGRVQPTAEELETKKTFLEDNSQYPRKVLVS